MKTLGTIGGGNMGAAIISRIRKDFTIIVCEQDERRRAYLRKNFKVSCQDLASLVKLSDILIVAVKPQDIDGVLAVMKAAGVENKLVISIAAGITISFIEKRLGPKARVIRTMPNLPAMIGEGMTAIAKGKRANDSDLALARRIFDCIGKTVLVEEKWIDAITAVSGSGPAYVFLFAECLINAAQSLGLDAKLSAALVKQTLLGGAHLLEKQTDDAAALRAKVTSKGGTTQAALEVFTRYKLDHIFKQALAAAQKRAKELSRR
jgi:pyrroline-5-carboxylate reductase